MKSVLLTDAETKQNVLVLFGEGGGVYAKPNKDDDGSYTEIFNASSDLIVSVIETPSTIQGLLERQ